MANKTTLFIGSVMGMSSQTITTGKGSASIAAGNYYLDHSTDSLSLCSALESALGDIPEFTPQVFIKKDRHIRVTFSSAASLDFTSAQTLKTLLGASSDTYSSSASHDFENISPLLWSPGYPGEFIYTPNGIQHNKEIVESVHKSLDLSNIQQETFGTRKRQGWQWDSIMASRLHTTDQNGLGGELRKFVDNVINLKYRFNVYDLVEEDDNSTAEITLTTKLGPYKKLEAVKRVWSRKKGTADDWGSFILDDCYVVTEMS